MSLSRTSLFCAASLVLGAAALAQTLPPATIAVPAGVVGAIDIHQRHTLVDVAEAEAALILKKLAGIRLKGIALAPTFAASATET